MASAAELLAGTPTERQDVDYRIDDFVLNPADTAVRFRQGKSKRQKRPAGSIDIAQAVIDTRLELTIEGASTLEITILDTDLRILRGDLLTSWGWGENADDRDEKHWVVAGRVIDAKLDDLWFRLVRVAKQDTDTVVLTFEDREVSKLREQRGPRKLYRSAHTTRAMFVQSLAREADVQTFIPELHKKQPIAKPPARTSSSTRRVTGLSGLGKGSVDITVKGAKADRDQLSSIQRCMEVADKSNAPELAALAMLCAGIGESGFRKGASDFASGTHKGVFQSNIIPPQDVERQAWHFLHGGQSFAEPGAIGLAHNSPSMSPGEIATRIENGGAAASFYGQYLPEARKIFRAFHGRATDTTLSVEVQKPYAFARGKSEDSWDTIQRLAGEVQWRAFVRKGVLWYVSDDYLFNQEPQLMVRERHGEQGDLVDSITYEVDLGARNLVTELSVTAHAGMWTALPGMVAEVVKGDQGIADGRWIVHSTERALSDDLVTVTQNKSLPAKPEPAPDTKQVSFGIPGLRDGGSSLQPGSISNLTPKQIIDRVVLPIARHHGINVTPASVAAANAAHGPTIDGNRSDHQGPPNYAWAADMSNGTTTPQEDALARDLAQLFGLHWTGSGVTERTAFGFRFQMLYRTLIGGNHFTHVHFGVRKA